MNDERWATVPEHPDYEVSDYGRVRRATGSTAGRVLSLTPTGKKRQYLRVGLHTKGIRSHHYVHRIVLRAFVGGRPTPKHECNHIDSDPSNNNLDNLEWVTRPENLRHAYRAGTMRPTRGELDGRARLTESQVLEIRARHSNGESMSELTRAYGVSYSCIKKVVRRIRWTHI